MGLELLLSQLNSSSKKRTAGMVSSKERVQRFCKENGVDVSAFLPNMRIFPKAAYADELEKYPVLKDE
jgi:hypothetical protein